MKQRHFGDDVAQPFGPFEAVGKTNPTHLVIEYTYDGGTKMGTVRYKVVSGPHMYDWNE